MTLLSILYVILSKIYYEKRRKEIMKDDESIENLDDSKKEAINYLSTLFNKIPVTVMLSFLISTTLFTILTIIMK